ncbi:MAG: LysM peptidoglycan-binding domain-containing protein, partial [Candidatus Poribacteria bacterium]|nr:LysM peptidoglycan-binding domain-containing protein [Candidatus Poribacteria bacterium]
MRKFETPFCIVLLWTFLMLNYCAFIAEGVDGESSLSLSDAAVKIREQVDIRNMRKDIARLSSLSTRVTGYPEAANASKYIFDRFTEIGLQNVEGRDFEITVPIDHGDGRLEVLNSNGEPTLVFQISPIWPNLIRTSLLPPNGLRVPIFYAGSSDLQDFNNKDIGGFWYEVKEGDTLESVANRFHVGVGAITDDILNDSLQKTDDGVDNNEDLQIDEYGEIPLLSDISIWAKDRIDNNGNGIIDEIPGDNTDGKDNDKDGQIDEKGEFIAASESSIFIPEGSVVLVDFNSSTRWINAAMLGAKAVVFIEPETTNRG